MLLQPDYRPSRKRPVMRRFFLLVSTALCFAGMTPDDSETVKDIGGLSEVPKQIPGFFKSN